MSYSLRTDKSKMIIYTIIILVLFGKWVLKLIQKKVIDTTNVCVLSDTVNVWFRNKVKAKKFSDVI